MLVTDVLELEKRRQFLESSMSEAAEYLLQHFSPNTSRSIFGLRRSHIRGSIAEFKFRRLLRSSGLGDGVIGEELGNKKSKTDFAWVVDIVDNAKAYDAGIPEWSILISLLTKDHRVLLAGIAMPSLQKSQILNVLELDQIEIPARDSTTRVIGLAGGPKSRLGKQLLQNNLTDSVKSSQGAQSVFDLIEGSIDVKISPDADMWDLLPLRILAGHQNFELVSDSELGIFGSSVILASERMNGSELEYLNLQENSKKTKKAQRAFLKVFSLDKKRV